MTNDDTQKSVVPESEARKPIDPGSIAQRPKFIVNDELSIKPEARVLWVKSHRSGRNISNQLDLYIAVESEPQNPGWIKLIEHSAYAAKCEELEDLADHFWRPW